MLVEVSIEIQPLRFHPMTSTQIATVNGVVTNSSDVARYAAAWQDRKRRMFVFKTVVYGLNLLIIVALVYGSSTRSRSYFWSHYMLLFPAWLVVYMAAGVWLNRFRCPRCGKFYYWTLLWRAPKNRRDCRHCGLAQDTLPV
jgi:hypothetical protein